LLCFASRTCLREHSNCRPNQMSSSFLLAPNHRHVINAKAAHYSYSTSSVKAPASTGITVYSQLQQIEAAVARLQQIQRQHEDGGFMHNAIMQNTQALVEVAEAIRLRSAQNQLTGTPEHLVIHYPKPPVVTEQMLIDRHNMLAAVLQAIHSLHAILQAFRLKRQVLESQLCDPSELRAVQVGMDNITAAIQRLHSIAEDVKTFSYIASGSTLATLRQ